MGDLGESVAIEGLVERANREAARSSIAWLTGLGLADALSKLARHASDVPIAVPGLEVLRDELDVAAADVARAADLVLSAANRELGLQFDVLEMQSERCAIGADDVQSVSRALAQLALGVTSQTFATDEVMRLERAAVVALAESAVRAAGDRFEIRSTNAHELTVEVAGLLARLLAETETAAAWRSDQDGESVEVVVSSDADLTVWLPERPMRRWPAPVMVTEPATEIATLLASWTAPLSAIRLDVTAVLA